MKKLLLLLCISSVVSIKAEPRNDVVRCANCDKKKKKEAELQAAGLMLAATVINGAFAVAANPDDKNSKLQAGNAIALGFIGLVAAAMRSMPFDVYDAFGNRIAPEAFAKNIAARLAIVDFTDDAELLIRAHIARIMQDEKKYTGQPI